MYCLLECICPALLQPGLWELTTVGPTGMFGIRLGPVLHLYALLELVVIQRQWTARVSWVSQRTLGVQLNPSVFPPISLPLSPLFPFNSNISFVEEVLWIVL